MKTIILSLLIALWCFSCGVAPKQTAVSQSFQSQPFEGTFVHSYKFYIQGKEDRQPNERDYYLWAADAKGFVCSVSGDLQRIDTRSRGAKGQVECLAAIAAVARERREEWGGVWFECLKTVNELLGGSVKQIAGARGAAIIGNRNVVTR